MLSPSPTQPKVEQIGPAQYTEPERKSVVLPPPAPKSAGQKRGSVIKAILRPILKTLYYIIRWIRTHKIAAFAAILLLLASIFATSYLVTGSVPLVSNSDSVRESVQNNPQLSDDVKNWLLALQNGDIDTMLSIQKSINPANRPTDSALYVLQFSEPHAQVKWTNVTVTSIKTAPDGLVDTYVEVDMTTPAQASGATKAIVLWHFSTDPAGRIYILDYVSARAS
jgi:hypothetical protein